VLSYSGASSRRRTTYAKGDCQQRAWLCNACQLVQSALYSFATSHYGRPTVRFESLSAEPTGRLYSWIPHDLEAEAIVFLPDACPGRSPLPTGTAVLTRQPNWRRFAVSDCGCGMRLLRSELGLDALDANRWDQLARELAGNAGGLGDLGGGNHFLDALATYDDGPLHFLIHTGSRAESGHVDHLVEKPEAFDAEFARVVEWASENRHCVQQTVERVFGGTECVLDLPHNTFELLSDGAAIVRKGCVRVSPGDLSVLPSHMSGDVALVRATDRVSETLFSMSHGTGRSMSRADAKVIAESYDFAALRRQVLMPSSLDDASLRTEGPYAYRDLDGCLAVIEDYVEVVSRFAVVGYIGHL